MHKIPKLECFSSCLAVVFAQSTEAMYQAKNEDEIGAAPKGDAPTTSGWWTILLPTKVHLILEIWQQVCLKRWRGNHWYWRVIMMPTLSSLTALEVIIMTTFSAASADKVGIMITLGFRW